MKVTGSLEVASAWALRFEEQQTCLATNQFAAASYVCVIMSLAVLLHQHLLCSLILLCEKLNQNLLISVCLDGKVGVIWKKINY